MESRIKVAGHGMHPILIAFPLGLLATSVIFDVIRMVWGDTALALVSWWLLIAGIVGGLIAAIPGLVDWLGIPRGTRAHRIGLMHAGVNVVALAIFFVSWRIRSSEPGMVPTNGAFVLAVVALLFAGLGGWLGGELVERLGVGVHDGANLDARNSLSGPVR